MRFSRALVVVGLVVVALTVRSSAQTPGSRRFVVGEVLVKFRPGVNANARADAHRVARGVGARRGRAHTGSARARIGGRGTRARSRVISAIPTSSSPNRTTSAAFPNRSRMATVPKSCPATTTSTSSGRLDNTGQGFYCIPLFPGWSVSRERYTRRRHRCPGSMGRLRGQL